MNFGSAVTWRLLFALRDVAQTIPLVRQRRVKTSFIRIFKGLQDKRPLNFHPLIWRVLDSPFKIRGSFSVWAAVNELKMQIADVAELLANLKEQNRGETYNLQKKCAGLGNVQGTLGTSVNNLKKQTQNIVKDMKEQDKQNRMFRLKLEEISQKGQFFLYWLFHFVLFQLIGWKLP